MPEDAVLYETRGALAFVTLNRPQRLNAIDFALIEGLEEAVARANREPEARGIVLRGGGRAFCAGYDLPTAPPAGGPAEGRGAEGRGLARRAVPADRLAAEVEWFAGKLATTPPNQLVMTKLLVNQAYENMALRTTQTLGTFMDGIARHTPEGLGWRDLAMGGGVQEAGRGRGEAG